MTEVTGIAPPPSDQPPVRSKNAGAFVGLGLAILGFLLALIPLVGIIGWPLMIAGLVLGIVGAAKKWQPMWANIVNIILGFVGPGLAIIIVSAGLVASSDATETPAGTQTPSSVEQADSGESEPTEADVASDKFGISIDSSSLGKDYKGEPILIVNYTFMNNSDKTQNFMFAFSDKAFQNGVELDSLVVSDEVDISSQLKDIKPGATIAIQSGYALDDDSDVTVEISELWNFKDEIIISKVFSVN